MSLSCITADKFGRVTAVGAARGAIGAGQSSEGNFRKPAEGAPSTTTSKPGGQ